MGGVYTEASMSLDGYIAAPGDTGFDQLFQSYENGDVAIGTAKPEMTFRTSAASAFVTEGIGAAVAQARELAGDRWVGVNGGSIARQCLEAGLLDEIRVNLVPVLLGGGVPFFDQVRDAPVELSNPTVVEGDRVTHLYYRVRRP
ncbi:dihydrofolate reductase family protein [Micromonospora sp. NPDC023633]|uniref:dihydrofolate reductase family protein n=1 Tax=Micromonospora sp. NPDC023633 TaxID=3154320 RepID=UPI0034018CE6